MRFLEVIRATVRLQRVDVDADLEIRAERILAQYADHAFSYADAVSFALMRERGIATAFAFDRHFLVAGFVTVPAPSI